MEKTNNKNEHKKTEEEVEHKQPLQPHSEKFKIAVDVKNILTSITRYLSGKITQKPLLYAWIILFLIIIAGFCAYKWRDINQEEIGWKNRYTNTSKEFNSCQTTLNNCNSSKNPLNLEDHYFDRAEGTYHLNRVYLVLYKFKTKSKIDDLCTAAWVRPKVEEKKSKPKVYIDLEDPSTSAEADKLNELPIKLITDGEKGSYEICVKLTDKSKKKKGDPNNNFIECEDIDIEE